MKTIQTREATVKTATVEIKTLSVSGRQVTLSVFRQIPEGMLVDPATLNLRGIPWGKVNYRWGDCAQKGEEHLHIVWQEGLELRRSCIEPNIRDQDGVRTRLTRWNNQREMLNEIGYLAMSLGTNPTVSSQYGYDDSNATLADSLGGFRWTHDSDLKTMILDCYRADNVLRFYQRREANGFSTNEYALKEVERIRPECAQARTQILDLIRQDRKPYLADFPEMETDDMARFAVVTLAALRTTTQAIENYQAGWTRRYQELAQLDQLFISA